jgi:lipoyl(octanoyl) transferase
MSKLIETIHFDEPQPYRKMLEVQRARVRQVQQQVAPNTLFLLEHTPVITLGRDAHAQNLLRSTQELLQEGVDVETTDRGGDVTYHGPGQLVAYPILDLQHWQPSVGWYLRMMEQVLINLLATYGLHGERMTGLTGVWCEGAKVAAIGIGVQRWVTFHGIALNVAPDMNHFGYIVPCGIADKAVTSVRALLGTTPPLEEVASRFEQCFLAAFEAIPVRPKPLSVSAGKARTGS